MAFPTVVGSTTFTRAQNATTSAVPYPTVSGGILANDVIFVLHGIDANASRITVPAGWSTLGEVQSSTADGVAYWKRAAGGETGTFTVSHTSERDSAIILVIRGVHTTSAPELTWGTAYDAADPDPPSETASWGAEDNLWVTGFFNDASVVATAAPTNYGNLTTIAGDLSNASGSLAYRQLNAATENPGTFTAAAEQGVAFTAVFRPVPSGSTQNQAITATATGTASLVQQGRIIRSATATGAASLIRSARKTLTVTATGTPTISRLQSLKLTLTATATGTATLVRRALTTLTATATGTATMTRQATVRITATGTGSASYGPVVVKKTLQAAGTGSPAVVKFTSRTLAAAATGTPSFQFTRVVMTVLTANATGTASLRRGAAHSIQAAAAGTASFKRDATHTIQTAALGTASFARRAAHTIQAAATGTAQFSTAGVIKVVLTATATGTASIVKRAALTLLAGGTGTASQTPVNAGTTATQQSITANATGTPSLGLLFIPNVGVRKWLMNLRTWARPPQTRRDDL